MKLIGKLCCVALLIGPFAAHAVGIFNTDPVQIVSPNSPPATTQSQAAPAAVVQQPPMQSQVAPSSTGAAVQDYQPATPPPASAVQVINANPKELQQFERLPNETDDAFIARMKVVYEQSAGELQTTTQTIVDNMKALAPK
jgi:hypothetical protein